MSRYYFAFFLSALVISSFWLFSLAPSALALECVCALGSGPPDIADCAACATHCSGGSPSRGGMTRFNGTALTSCPSGSGGADSACECTPGDASSRASITGTDLAGCCTACRKTAPQQVGFNGASETCPAAATAPAAPDSAAKKTGGSSTRLHNPLGNVTIPSLISRVIRAIIGLTGSIALLMFIYGGIRWITAGGSEEHVKSAKTIIQNATIGLLMIFLSYTIVAAFFGILTSGT